MKLNKIQTCGPNKPSKQRKRILKIKKFYLIGFKNTSISIKIKLQNFGKFLAAFTMRPTDQIPMHNIN